MVPGKLYGSGGKFPVAPKLPEMFPIPFEDIEEYWAVVATPKRAPLAALMSSVPARVPAPSAVNSPEKIVWKREFGLIAELTYLPWTELLANGPAACGSPNPDGAEVPPEVSGVIRKAWLVPTR